MFGNNWIEDYVRAGSSKTSEEQLAKLAHSDHAKIRMRVAENPRTPTKVLELLARDPESDVRLAAGTNGSTPVDVVYGLALDSDPTVRHGLAEDPNMPLGVLKILANDDNAYVRCRATKTLSAIAEPRNSVLNSVSFWQFNHRQYA